MQLVGLRVVGLGPFDDVRVSFDSPQGTARPMTVIFGGPGVGKTTLLGAIAQTRPGHAPVLRRLTGEGEGFAAADWWLGDDEPARPHPLRVASPNAVLDESEDQARFRKREQALYDRRALEGGYALLALLALRWFSRTPAVLTVPERTVVHYDVRASPSFDDASRADLSRETKQAIVYARIVGALAQAPGFAPRSQAQEQADRFFEQAMDQVINALVRLAGYQFVGLSASSLEPLFQASHGTVLPFDALPTAVRHLVGIGALTVRTLRAAYPGKDPRQAQAVVIIDEAAQHQPQAVQHALPATLKAILPRVQWILTTSSPELALVCDSHEVVALRRLDQSSQVQVYQGREAVLH